MQHTWVTRGGLLLALAWVGCGGGSSGKSAADGGAGSGSEDAGGDAAQGDRGASSACGELAADTVCVVGQLKSASASAKSGASVSVLGQPAAAGKSRDDGSFAVVLDKKLNPVTTGGTKSEARKEVNGAADYTLILHKSEDKAGRTIKAKIGEVHKAPGDELTFDLGTVDLLPTGKIAGTVTLAGASDQTGIQVYIPGTSYLATTAANGQFVMSDVPAGLYPFLRAERDGYNYAIVADVEVPSEGTASVQPLTLSLDTGAKGTVGFSGALQDGQGAYATDATVVLSLVATDGAVLMMVSEDKSFVGASWKPMQTQLPYTFAGDGAHTVYVKFANANGLESSPVSATITIDTDPKVRLTSPGTTTTSSRPMLDWTDTRIAGATYAVQLATDAAFSDLLVDKTGLSVSQLELTATLSGHPSYYARVRIEDGKARSWSDVLNFAVDFGSVQLLSPQGAQPSSRPTLDWSEPTLAGAKYHLQVTEGVNFATPIVDVNDLTTSIFSLTQTLEQGKQYAFRVAVKDDYGVEGPFSSPQSFSVDLGAVAIVPPGNPQSDSTPTFSWSASALPAATYRVQISKSESFATLVDQASNLTQPVYTTSVLEHGQTYYVRVAVVDQYGAQGVWAGPASFGVDLGSVSLSSPAEDTLTNDKTPSFSWSQNAVATSYILSYGTDATLAGATQVAGIADVQTTLANALPDTPLTTYYWAVTPVDAHGVAGTRSAIRSFRLDTQAPSGSFVINNGDVTTHNEVVSVLLRGSDASGVAQVMAAKADPDPNASWVAPSGAITLDYSELATTNTGTITAYGYFRDNAGNVSAKYTDTITLKRTVVQASNLSADATWSAAQSPYYVTGDVIVLHPATLTLAPGAVVYFKAGKKIEVRSGGHAGEAGLSAVGTNGSPITLNGARIDLNYAADWVNGGRVATHDGNGNYVQGPRLDYVQMTDGRIHVRISTFDGPGFYMRHSNLQTLSADFFGYVLGTYIEHSTVGTMGDANQALNLDGSQVLNSYVTSMNIDGYSYANGVKIQDCEIGALTIDRWVPAKNTLAYNRIYALTWNRPSTTNSAELHNNSFLGTGTVLTVGADTGGSGANLNASGNYWGISATVEMDAQQQNITAIRDFYDDTNLVIVDYTGYLAAPVPSAGPDW